MRHALLAISLLVGSLAGASAGQGFTVSGAFGYADKAWDYAGWTGAKQESALRLADVSVLDKATGKLLGRGVTAQDGSFSIACTSKQPVVDVQVRADARNRHYRKLVGQFARVSVVDAQGLLYSVSSPVFAEHSAAADLDVGTTIAQPVKVAANDGSPFNVFDLAISSFETLYAQPLGAAVGRGSITLHWPSFSGSWALGRHARIGDDDGFDDAVILHEIGHVVHNLYSDSDNPGGTHYFGDSDQDPRLSLAEGFATFFAGTVLNALGQPAIYMDADGAATTGGVQLRLRLEDSAPYFASVEGAADEVAVACVLHDLLDDEDSADAMPGVDDDAFVSTLQVNGLSAARAWWQVFTGPVRKARRVTINDVWDGWLAVHAPDARYVELKSAFEQRRIRFWNDLREPDGTPELATPLLPSTGSDWGPEHTLYYTPFDGHPDGSGDRDWFSVELAAGQLVRIETRYPEGAWDARTEADPFLTLRSPSGELLASDDDGGAGRNALLELAVTETGSFRVEVRSRNSMQRYGRYNVRVVLLSAP